MNLVLITSVINTSKKPLSYTTTRSAHSYADRFTDTQLTIESVKKYIPESKIFLIECSLLNEADENYLKANVDLYLNLWSQEKIVEQTTSKSKSMGEGVMTIEALLYLKENNVVYDNLFKISGRYWLNDVFNYKLYSHELICVHRILKDHDNVFTCFYKLPKRIAEQWCDFLQHSFEDFDNYVAYEHIFGKFINSLPDDKVEIFKVGINGYVSVSKDFVDM
jgi:hypothetical protein